MQLASSIQRGSQNFQVTHRYIWESPLRIAVEIDDEHSATNRYIYANGINTPELLIRKRHDDCPSGNPSCGDADGTYRIFTDERGSPIYVVSVTDPSKVLLDATYSATGEVLHFTSLVKDTEGNDLWPLAHGFAGGLYDQSTGLVRFGARDYDARSGRWTARDPILFDGGQANLYVYVANDPVNAIDPEGRWSVGLSAYLGFGGSFSFGHANGAWFVEYSYGAGIDAGIGVDFGAEYPGRIEGYEQKYDGLAASAGVSVGPLTLEGVLGGATNFDILPDGTLRPREPISFVESVWSWSRWKLGIGFKGGEVGGWSGTAVQCGQP